MTTRPPELLQHLDPVMGKASGSLPAATFAAQINAATRTEHTKLNKLILARLPLSLPPTSQDPSAYATGIAAFAPIFFAFEEAWRDILSTAATAHSTSNVTQSTQFPLASLLASLHQPGLERTENLQSDLKALGERLDPKSGLQLHPLIEKSITSTSHSIKSSIQQGPHRILAYAWTMYMALFNGGRWLRQQMINAGPDFWLAPQNVQSAEDYGCLSLWFFDRTSDGEDLKNFFKDGFEDIALRLDDSQRSDIVNEAVNLFKMCSQIIEDVLDKSMLEDAVTGTNDEEKLAAALASKPPTRCSAGLSYPPTSTPRTWGKHRDGFIYPNHALILIISLIVGLFLFLCSNFTNQFGLGSKPYSFIPNDW